MSFRGIALMVACVLMFAGCGEDPPSEPVKDTAIEGSWKASASFTLNGAEAFAYFTTLTIARHDGDWALDNVCPHASATVIATGTPPDMAIATNAEVCNISATGCSDGTFTPTHFHATRTSTGGLEATLHGTATLCGDQIQASIIYHGT